jgi:phosphate-selective porin OprO/OprP
MQSLKAELEQTKAQAKSSDKVVQEIKDAKIAMKPENNVKITMSPAPKFETADGAYSFKVGGFAQVDAGVFQDDVRDHPDGTNVRRARLSATGTLAKDFKYKIENDFAVTPNTTTSSLIDIYLEYAGFENVSIMAGQFKEPFGMEVLTSDLFTTFMERASILAFAPDRNIGLAVSTYGDSPMGNWSATVGGFNGNAGTASTDDEARDLTGRLTFAPFAGKTEVLHFGVAGSHRIPDSASDTMRFSSRPETRLTSSQSVDTGNISGVDSVDLIGFEAAGVYGPFSLQGEYMMAAVDRRTGLTDEDFSGYYAEASYFLTGESRNYVASQGKFDRVTPKWPFSLKGDGWGAWQVGARWGEINLDDNTIRGGRMKDVTLGLRWLPTANIAFAVNYVRADTDAFSTTPHDDPQVWMIRSQFDF